MSRADWTYELPPVTGDSIWLEEYLVYDGDGFPVGRVFAVLEHERRRWLAVEREPLPTRHDRRAVPFEAIAEIDHENTAVHLTLGPGAIEETLELDPGNGVERGAEARRITSVPAEELPRRREPMARSRVDRGIVMAAFLLALAGILALWAVFVLWASSKSPAVLPYLTVPGALLGAAAFLGFPSRSRR